MSIPDSQPFSAEAVAKRASEMPSVAPSISDRANYLVSRVKGARVLDVGVVEHSVEASYSSGWLHRRISEAASYCLGIDILADDLDVLERQGYNVRLHDISESPLEEDFDFVVLGELIEHVGNPEGLLRNSALCLSPGGRLFLTTPNPWYVNYIRTALRSGWALDNTDHIAWFDPATLYALGSRTGLRLVSFSGLSGMHTRTLTGGLAKRGLSILRAAGIGPLISCKSILYEFEKATSEA
ncbi:MAG: class I SAM-dependent methyltransferase [Erythrobacter sp.]|jgi:SAM-dependent methyltransferase|nr:class I SAM-dependent methyltransferase [Erythrobacter sp.]